VDLKQFCRELVEYLRGLILMKGGADTAVDAPKETLAEMKKMAEKATMLQLSKAARIFRDVEMQSDGFSSLPMELALVECTVRARDDRAVHAAPVAEKAEAPAIRAEKPATPAAPVVEKPQAAPRKAKQAKTAAEAPDVTTAGAIGESPSPEKSAKIIEKKEPKAEPVAATPAAPTVKAKEPAGPINIDILRKRWSEVVKATKGMGSRGNLDALLRSACEPVSVNDDTIVLGFYYEFHKEKIEDPIYRHMVEDKVKEIFG
jgi:DNA polymerase-3 subunit gamma/tau